MISYKAYLTKSKEVAEKLSRALEIDKQYLLEVDSSLEVNISYGKLYTDDSIPRMYHNRDFYYAVICIHGTSNEAYEIIFA